MPRQLGFDDDGFEGVSRILESVRRRLIGFDRTGSLPEAQIILGSHEIQSLDPLESGGLDLRDDLLLTGTDMTENPGAAEPGYSFEVDHHQFTARSERGMQTAKGRLWILEVVIGVTGKHQVHTVRRQPHRLL